MANTQQPHGDGISYVVSRSGKVLNSYGTILEYQEQKQLVPVSDPPLISEAANTYEAESTKKKRRTITWHDEVGALRDIADAVIRGKKGKPELQRSETSSSEGTDYCGRSNLLEDRLKTAISQMLNLQRWQPGSREVQARWASWLLKMLRKARPLPKGLQKFLFAVSGTVLPRMCLTLVCQTLQILPDLEVLNSVDIFCFALWRSRSCFSSYQWEILESRICQCLQVRPRAGTWIERATKKPDGRHRVRHCRKRFSASLKGFQPLENQQLLLPGFHPKHRELKDKLKAIGDDSESWKLDEQACGDPVDTQKTEASTQRLPSILSHQKSPFEANPAKSKQDSRETKQTAASAETPGLHEISLHDLVENVLRKAR